MQLNKINDPPEPDRHQAVHFAKKWHLHFGVH